MICTRPPTRARRRRSPRATSALLEAGLHSPIPYLPAVASASELMLGLAHGYHCFKFFPAALAGGVPMLKTFAGPFPQARLLPDGWHHPGYGPHLPRSAQRALCGGSWLSPAQALAARDWTRIEALAAAAARARG